MAGRFNGEWKNPDTGAKYEEACFAVNNVQLFGHGNYQAGHQAYVSWDVWSTQENMEAGNKPIYSTKCLLAGAPFDLYFNNTYESVPDAEIPGNLIMMAEQQLAEMCSVGGEDEGYDPIYQDLGQLPRAQVELFTGTAEQADLCEPTDIVEAWYTIQFDDWANSSLYTTDNQLDDTVLPSGWYWDGNKAREWVATSETEGNWSGSINPCGAEPAFFTISTEPGDEPQQLNIFIETQEEISGLHFQLKPTIDFTGEFIGLESIEGGLLMENGWITFGPYDNEDIVIGSTAQSFIPLTLEGNYISSDVGQQLLCTLIFAGDITGIWEGYGTEIFSGIRAANTNFGDGLDGTNGAWTLDETMNIIDVITGAGFLGGVNGLKGIANDPIHDMSGSGGVENMAAAIQIVLDAGTEEDTMTTEHSDLIYEWG